MAPELFLCGQGAYQWHARRIETAAAALSIIASVGSLTQAYFALRERGHTEIDEKLLVSTARNEFPKDFRNDASVIAMRTGDDFGEQLLGKAQASKKELMDTIHNDDISLANKDQIFAAKRKELCFWLFQLRQHLRDDFPDDLRDEWRNNNCKDFAF